MLETLVSLTETLCNLVWNFCRKPNRCVFTFSCRIFVPIHICHLFQPALSTRYYVQGAWNWAIPYTLKTPRHTARKCVMNRLSQRESLQIALHYGALAKIQNPWRRRRRLLGQLKVKMSQQNTCRKKKVFASRWEERRKPSNANGFLVKSKYLFRILGGNKNSQQHDGGGRDSEHTDAECVDAAVALLLCSGYWRRKVECSTGGRGVQH
jgi:hypothetical protein